MSVIVADSFTDINGTLLGAHTPTLGTGWVDVGLTAGPAQFTIKNNQLNMSVTPGTSLIGKVIDTIISSTQYVQVAYKTLVTKDVNLFLIARSTAGLGALFTAYILNIFPLTGDMRILGYVNGVLVYNSGFFASPVGLGTYKFLLVGASLKAYKDDIQYISVVNGAIAASGRVGLGFGASLGIADALVMDDFVGDDTIENTSYSKSFASGRGRFKRRIKAFNPVDII